MKSGIKRGPRTRALQLTNVRTTATGSVVQALLDARMALATTHNVLATDRPDLPRAPDTGWTTDFSVEIRALDQAIRSVVGPLHKCLECGRCSTSLVNVPSTDPARCEGALEGSHTPGEAHL